jgi:hypothetical protein
MSQSYRRHSRKKNANVKKNKKKDMYGTLDDLAADFRTNLVRQVSASPPCHFHAELSCVYNNVVNWKTIKS